MVRLSLLPESWHCGAEVVPKAFSYRIQTSRFRSAAGFVLGAFRAFRACCAAALPCFAVNKCAKPSKALQGVRLSFLPESWHCGADASALAYHSCCGHLRPSGLLCKHWTRPDALLVALLAFSIASGSAAPGRSPLNMFYERMLIHASVRRVLGLFQVGLIGIKVLQAIAWGGETCKAFLRRSRASARSASKWKDQKTLRFLKGLALRHGLSPKLRAFDLPSLPMLLSCRPLFAI